MARLFMIERYGDATYTNGFKIVTPCANRSGGGEPSSAANVMDYDRRHGWRGPEAQLTLPPRAPQGRDSGRFVAGLR